MTPLGLGTAPIGNLYQAISDRDATSTVDAAWAAGVRYFDTAPHYGLGLAERRLGQALRGRPRHEYVLSTKVGRVLVDNPAGAGQRDDGFDVPATLRRVWDFTADGVRRSLAGSLARLGLDRVEIVLIHDPEESPDPRAALDQAYPALHELRAQGVVDAIGVGSKQRQVLTRFVTETDIDVVLLAGRYTLLEQPALDDLLPACQRWGVSVLNAGVFNSGLLAVDSPDASARYEYSPVPAPLLQRARRIAALCRRYGATLPQAALAFAAAHPVVASVLVGAATPEQMAHDAQLLACPAPPADLWRELVAQRLLRPDAPVPGGHDGHPGPGVPSRGAHGD
ncbi:MAG: aldo/keto reductase [Micromonosporaceae bacterium]|nr:aldo/keto reductase [Micromonosporaceae bacterium]